MRTVISTMVLVMENLNLGIINHTNSFLHRHHEQDTELSKHIWKLKDKGINFKVKWSVAAYASKYRCGSRRCDLCLREKYVIARANHMNLLNKRTEII